MKDTTGCDNPFHPSSSRAHPSAFILALARVAEGKGLRPQAGNCQSEIAYVQGL